MSDQLALLAAVRAAPDDDTPRLAYADWLQEQGGAANAARSEFIRAQIGWYRSVETGPGDKKLKARASRLEKQHKAAWLAPFGEAIAEAAGFHRGFVDSVELAAASFRPRRPVPWHLEPVATVWLGGDERAVTAALPRVAGVYGLSFRLERPEPPEIEEDEYEPDIPFDPPDFVGDRLLAVIAAVPAFASLRSLNLSGAHVTDDGAATLAASHLCNLRDLHLWWNWMTAGGWQALFGSTVLDAVEELDLTADQAMEREDMEVDYPGDKGAAVLASSPHVGRLRELKLDGNGIGVKGAAALGASKRLGSLEKLSFSGSDWKAGPLRALAAGGGLPRLRELDLGINQLGADAMRALAKSPLLARLTNLNLAFNPIDAAALTALLSARDLSRLEELNLMEASPGEHGIKALARCTKLTGLRRLCLAHVRFTTRMLSALLSARWLDQLRDLDMVKSRLNAAGRERLKRRLGGVVSFRW